jgi:predicted acylesterase/phospholipase RssA
MGKRWTFTNLLQRYYANLFRNKTLGDLKRQSHQPQVFFNCASLSTGSICSFSRSGFMWYENDKEEYVECPQTPVAFACAASSAFPPLFPPIEVSHETLFCSQARFPNALYLTDGGVYDNLGVDRLLWYHKQANDIDLFVVSNAEGSFDSEFKARYAFFVSRNIRASNLLMTRVSAQTLKELNATFSSVVNVEIRGETKDTQDPTRLTAPIQRSLCSVRTDLDEFSPKEVAALVAHGYAKAREQFIANEVIGADVPRMSWDPLGNLVTLRDSSSDISELQKSNSELRKSSERKWRILSRTDWASFALISIILFYVFFPIVYSATLYLEAEAAREEAEAARELALQRAGQQIAAEASRNKVEDRVRELEVALTRINRQPPSQTILSGWQLDRLGFDCPGKDISATAGAVPEPGKCTSAGLTAVCWDGVEFKNRSQFGGDPWCTYKALSPERCVGGTAPGRLFRCVPSG